MAMPSQNALKLPATRPGEDVERRAALARRGDDFPDVRRLGGGEDLDELRDDRAGQRAAGDDRRQLPPERSGRRRGSESAGRTRRTSAPTETIDVSQTRRVSGASKFILSTLRVLRLGHRFVDRSTTAPMAMTIMMRITKIQTSSWTWIGRIGHREQDEARSARRRSRRRSRSRRRWARPSRRRCRRCSPRSRPGCARRLP